MRIILLILISTASFAQIVVTNTAELTTAMNTAQSGQTVILRGGTYRMTVTPLNNGVTFRNYENETAVISGLNQVTGSWSVHSGNIYKVSVTLPVNGFSTNLTTNTTLLANQVFKDGEMMHQARWPNVSTVEDLIDRGLPGTSNPGKYRHYSQSQGLTRYSVTDQGLPAGNFTGGSIWVTGWFISETRTITGHSGKTLSYSGLNENTKFQRWYYIINDLELLDAAKEWYYENGTLYFWQAGGGLPTNVEYKARNWGFDLRGKDNTKIIGLTFIGCEPATGDEGTDGTVIDNIRASYNNHAFVSGGDHAYFNADKTGIKLLGRNNTIRNSEFKHISAQVIWAGEGAVIENNLLYNHGWEGNYGAFVTPWGTIGGNIKINRNTATRLGRSAVDFGRGSHPNIEVGYNEFGFYSMVTSDVGATYGSRGTQIPGSRVHHNWIHDNMTYDGWKVAANFDGIHVGVYFDQGVGPSTIDHNVMWNNSVADGYSEIKNGVLTNWYNNTFGTDVSYGGRESYFCPRDSPSDAFRNNIFRYTVNINWKPATTNDNPNQPGDVNYCIFQNTDPKFVGPVKTGLGYALQNTSPAINVGTVISGITDGSIGTPDAGAYEFGATPWVPGYKATSPTPPDPEPIPPDTLDPEPPLPPIVLTDTVINIVLPKPYRTVTTKITRGYDTTTTPTPTPVVIEAESATITPTSGASLQGSTICCIQPNATLTYRALTYVSTGTITIRYSRGNPGNGTLTFKIGTGTTAKTGTLSLPQTSTVNGDWSAWKEITLDIPVGSGEISFFSPAMGPCNLDWFILE